MKCVDRKCRGEVGSEPSINLMTGCSSASSAYACKKCGRLHWPNGRGVRNRGGQRAFVKDGHLVHVNRRGKETVMI